MVAAWRLQGMRSDAPARPSIGSSCGGFAAEDPGGRVVGDGQALEAQAQRRLAEDEADARRLRRAAICVRVIVQPGEPGRSGQAQVRGRGALTEAPQVLAEPRLDGSLGARVEPLDEPADAPERLLEREPRIAFPELRAGLRADVARRDAERGVPAWTGAEPARRKDRVKQRQAQGGHDRSGSQVALDALEDGSETDHLTGCVEVEQLVGQGLGAPDVGEPAEQRSPHRVGADIGLDPLEVIGIERCLAELGAAQLVAADRAAVMPGDRPHPAGDAGVVVDRPDDFVDDEGSAARRAASREHVPDRDLETGFTPRRGGQALERRVEMADVRRSQHDLGEHPVERARLERDRAALPVDGRPGDPAATPEQVGHDVAGTGVVVDPRRRRRRRAARARGGRRRVARNPAGHHGVRGRSSDRC